MDERGSYFRSTATVVTRAAQSDDQTLIERYIVQGDDTALMQLWDRYQHQAFCYAWSFVCRRPAPGPEAEDIVADAFEYFWRTYGGANRVHLQPHTHFWPLFRTIVKHTALNFLDRMAQRSTTVGLSALEPDALLMSGASGVGPEDLAEVREAAREAGAAIRALKNRDQQRAVVLRLRGLSYAEIAVTIRKTPGHVGMLIQRARVAVHRHLRSRGYEVWREPPCATAPGGPDTRPPAPATATADGSPRKGGADHV